MRVYISHLANFLSFLSIFKEASTFVGNPCLAKAQIHRGRQASLLRLAAAAKPSTPTQKKGTTKKKPSQPPVNNATNVTETDETKTGITDQDVQNLLESVSDAEALLACRAYLVKRRRWSADNDDDDDDDGGWSEWTRRQSAQQQTWEDESTGFFWEDLSQLEYWDPLGSPLRRQINISSSTLEDKATVPNEISIVEDNGEQTNGEDDDDGGDDEAMHSSDTDASMALVGGDALIPLSAWLDVYLEDQSPALSWEDTEPSPEYLRRSEAARRTFSDPEWKAYWYERRWGSRQAKRRRAAEQKLHQRLSSKWQAASQSEMLAPLANMTQDEMAQAIVNYASANQRRSKSRQAWAQQQAQARRNRLQQQQQLADRSASNNTTIGETPRDTLLTVNATELEEKRRIRAERARKAYQTRMEMRKSRSQQTDPGSSISPVEALRRLKDAMDQGASPAPEWVERVTEASHLPQHKEILLRLLQENFGMGEKQWLPMDEKENSASTEDPPSLTHRSVKELGQSCLLLLASIDSPAKALELVETSLNQGNLPASTWVKTTLQPGRLAGRKPIYLRVLAEFFELRGRQCLPTEDEQDSEELPFLTQRSVTELGEACFSLIREREQALDDD